LLIDFDKKNTPPTLSHGEGRWGKNLKITINEGIVIKKLTKKHPTHLLYLRRWLEQWIIISKVYISPSLISAWSTTCSFGNEIRLPLSCFSIELGATLSYSIIKMVFLQINFNFVSIYYRCSANINICLHSLLNNISWNQCNQILDVAACICSWIISAGTNVAKSSTLAFVVPLPLLPYLFHLQHHGHHPHHSLFSCKFAFAKKHKQHS